MGGQPQRLGVKQSKGHSRFKKFVAGSVALGGAILGHKANEEIKKQQRDQFEFARNQLSGDLQSLKQEAGLKKMEGGGLPTASGGVAVGGNVIGADSSGNIIFGAGVQAGRGVEANPNIVVGRGRDLPVGRLTPQQLAPFQPKREGLRAVAGVVGGAISPAEAVRDVARAGFEGMGGRRGTDPLEDFRRGEDRGSRAGGTLVAGATGEERFTAKESAKILGRRAGRAVGKILPFGG